jgi:hypothetical protein
MWVEVQSRQKIVFNKGRDFAFWLVLMYINMITNSYIILNHDLLETKPTQTKYFIYLQYFGGAGV